MQQSRITYPKHLKDPETKEREEFIPLVVKSIVLTGLDDPEKEEARESSSPQHNEQRSNDLASMMMTGKGQRNDS